MAATLLGATVGALTHVVGDLFAHDDRWGPQRIGWLRETAFTVAGHDLSGARVLQYVSHIFGSAVAVVLLRQLLRSGSLLAWYGVANRSGIDRGAGGGSVRFAAVTAIAMAAGGYWALADPGLPARVIRLTAGLGAGLVAASFACRRFVDLTR